MPLYHGEPRLAKPAKQHTLTAAAEYARTAHRRHAYLKANGGALVTDHGRPPWVPFTGDVVPSAARTLQRLAESAGFDVRVHERRDGCTVEGLHAGLRLGFRAHWTRGRTDGASWHEPLRFAMIEDHRTVETTPTFGNVAKAGHRAAGMDTRHLVQVSSPHGMPANITTLTAKLKELANPEETTE